MTDPSARPDGAPVLADETPSVKPGEMFTYFDPIDLLPPEGRACWADPALHQPMIDDALAKARAGRR